MIFFIFINIEFFLFVNKSSVCCYGFVYEKLGIFGLVLEKMVLFKVMNLVFEFYLFW